MAGIKQAFSSNKTSLNQIPAMFKKIVGNLGEGSRNIDIGGGKYDKATQFLADNGVNSSVFDPFNRVSEHNAAVLDDLIKNGQMDTATVANVLNVIQEPGARSNVINQAARSIKPDGTAYFSIYEGAPKNKGIPGQSGADMFQNNQPASFYLPEIQQYFDDVTRKGNIITARGPKSEEKAYWLLSEPSVTGDTGPQAGKVVRYGLGGGLIGALANSDSQASELPPGVPTAEQEALEEPLFDVADVITAPIGAATKLGKVAATAAMPAVNYATDKAMDLFDSLFGD